MLLSGGVAQAALDSTLISFPMQDQFEQEHSDAQGDTPIPKAPR